MMDWGVNMNNRFLKKLIVSLLCAVFLISFLHKDAYARAYLLPWNLVDSGKHLDYDYNSVYLSNITNGVNRWNNYKSDVIRPDSIWVVEDVYISDVNISNGWAGLTSANGTIQLNRYHMDSYPPYKITNVVAHELGHALGLDHSTSTDLMDASITSHTSAQALSRNDKDSYDAAYNNY